MGILFSGKNYQRLVIFVLWLARYAYFRNCVLSLAWDKYNTRICPSLFDKLEARCVHFGAPHELSPNLTWNQWMGPFKAFMTYIKTHVCMWLFFFFSCSISNAVDFNKSKNVTKRILWEAVVSSSINRCLKGLLHSLLFKRRIFVFVSETQPLNQSLLCTWKTHRHAVWGISID